MTKIITLLITTLISYGVSFQANASDDDTEFRLNADNCVASKWYDSSNNNISFDEKFGEGATAATRCLKKTKNVKALYQINTLCKNSECTAAYAIGNIQNHIKDMKITHGMTDEDYEVAVVVHSGGWKLVLDNNSSAPHAASNPFQADVEALVANPRVHVLFCQNTAAKKGIKLNQMISGIGFVTAGVSALNDLQSSGFKYIQP